MQIKTFTYEKSWYGTYYRRAIFSAERMDGHIAKMIGTGWQILINSAHAGQGMGLQPFAKRDTITVSFQKP